jgi:hypothetical protein
MNIDDYPHCSLGEDGYLRTTGRHCPGFLRVLLCALVHLCYDGPIPVYHCRPFQAHGLNCCEVRVEIPIDPMTPWIGAIIRSEVGDAVEKMAHMALTAMCEQRLTDTTGMPIALFLIQDQEDFEWRQHLEAACDLTSPQFNAG